MFIWNIFRSNEYLTKYNESFIFLTELRDVCTVISLSIATFFVYEINIRHMTYAK
jgi:hypothetical protein